MDNEIVIADNGSVGLVLEGGGMRGVFTAGVLDFFLDHSLEFDDCVAVSAGACHAVSYLSKQRGRAYDVAVDYLDDWHYCSVRNRIFTGSLFGMKMLFERIPRELNHLDYDTFRKKHTRFSAVVTNCLNGEAELLPVDDAELDLIHVQASSSLPLLTQMTWINGMPYLDGGIVDSIPLRYSITHGNTKHVVVMTQPEGFVRQPMEFLWLMRVYYARYPKLVEALAQRHLRYNESVDLVREQEAAGNTFVIRPDADLGVHRIDKDKNKLRATYLRGYDKAKSVMPELLKFLKSS